MNAGDNIISENFQFMARTNAHTHTAHNSWRFDVVFFLSLQICQTIGTHSVCFLDDDFPVDAKVNEQTSTHTHTLEQIYRFSRISKWYNVLLAKRNKLKSEMNQNKTQFKKYVCYRTPELISEVHVKGKITITTEMAAVAAAANISSSMNIKWR